jgi:predicted O-linked N-acetylglucosamine transferase (SPINDLY family)
LSNDQTLRRALAVEPGQHALMQALYVDRYGAGRYAEASSFCGRSVAIEPDNADDLCNLGEIHVRLERRREAARAFARTLALAPAFGDAHRKRGLNCQLLGEFDAAEACYGRALALMPEKGELEILRLFAAMANAPEAQIPAYIDRILAAPARTAEELSVRASALWGRGYDREAARAWTQVLALKPDAFDYWVNRGVSLASLSRYDEAVRGARRALAIKPDYSHAYTNLIFWLDFLPDRDFAADQAERRRWAEIQRKSVPPPAPHANVRDPDRRLRLGYVSSDFKGHAVAGVFGPVLRRHDRSRFELFLYSGVVREDNSTSEFRAQATEWRSTLGLSPDALADRIRADRVDILIDLSGHTAGNHLLTFLRKPAPVQVTAWGSATGTGLSEIDYFLADPVLVPEVVRGLFAEEIYDLPGAIAYGRFDGLPEVSPSPASSGEPAVYGCFNRAIKIGPASVDAWSRILSRVPGARLYLKDRAFDQVIVRERLRDGFTARGIDADRVEFAGSTSRAEHLDAHRRVDIALDPFPANGGVTTSEALMMGVPVVALLGSSAVSRTSASLLSAVGLPDWIAADVDGYVDIAVAWSTRIDALTALRQTLRSRYFASPVGDTDAYTRAVEAAYRDMWRRWCDGRRHSPGLTSPA